MRENLALREEKGEEIVQYHGKWPFVRVLGIQELFSCVFSILNFVPHFLGIRRLWRVIPLSMRPSLMLWTVYAVMGMNAWLWSAVFHARDWRSTELLDYFSADLFVVGSLACTICRVFFFKKTIEIGLVWSVSLFFYLRHVYQMLNAFDYGYNTFAALCVGTLGTILWGVFLLRHRPKYGWKIILAHAMMWVAALLEVYDFPPFFDLLDAHSLWHGATVPVGFLWYSFLEDDLKASTKLKAFKDNSKLKW